jgi:ABC-type uncharacterized transport system involved in gliding motility auxiliary subunit
MITLGVEVKGTLPSLDKAKDKDKEKKDDNSAAKAFQAVVFGDSDFLSNRGLFLGVNRDLALNAFAGLTNQKDLLSIRPKLPKGSIVVLTQVSRLMIIISFMALPILLLLTSGVLWFRRRGA